MYLNKTMLRPLYMYANAAWANVTKSDLYKIQKEQNKAIRLAYKLPLWRNVLWRNVCGGTTSNKKLSNSK